MKRKDIFIESCCLICLKLNSAWQYWRGNWLDTSSWASSGIKSFFWTERRKTLFADSASSGSSLIDCLTPCYCKAVLWFHVIIRMPGWFIACCEWKNTYGRISGRVWKKCEILIQGSWGDKTLWKSESKNVKLQTNRYIWMKLRVKSKHTSINCPLYSSSYLKI